MVVPRPCGQRIGLTAVDSIRVGGDGWRMNGFARLVGNQLAGSRGSRSGLVAASCAPLNVARGGERRERWKDSRRVRIVRGRYCLAKRVFCLFVETNESVIPGEGCWICRIQPGGERAELSAAASFAAASLSSQRRRHPTPPRNDEEERGRGWAGERARLQGEQDGEGGQKRENMIPIPATTTPKVPKPGLHPIWGTGPGPWGPAPRRTLCGPFFLFAGCPSRQRCC